MRRFDYRGFTIVGRVFNWQIALDGDKSSRRYSSRSRAKADIDWLYNRGLVASSTIENRSRECGMTDHDAVCACGCSGYDEWCGNEKHLVTHWQKSKTDD